MIDAASYLHAELRAVVGGPVGPHESLEARARRCIEEDCPYAFSFRFLDFAARNGVLTVRGCLPSFYLKQVLLACLQRLGEIRIDDRVDVVCSTGLSSVSRSSAA
jgi:hypothetical protein